MRANTNQKLNMNSKSKGTLGYILVLLTVLIWAIEPILIKDVSNFASENVQNIFRNIGAVIALSVILKLGKTKSSNNKKVKKTRKYLLTISMLAIITYIQCTVSISGMKLSSADIASFIGTGIGSLITILVLALFIQKERKILKRKEAKIAIAIALVGAFLLINDSGSITTFTINIGTLILILAEIIWAIYVLIYDRFTEGKSIARVSIDTSIATIILIFIIMLIKGEMNELLSLNVIQIAKMIASGAIIDAGTVLTYYPAMKLVSGVKVNTITLLCPLVTLVLARVILNEAIMPVQLAGGLIVILASFIMIKIDTKK